MEQCNTTPSSIYFETSRQYLSKLCFMVLIDMKDPQVVLFTKSCLMCAAWGASNSCSTRPLMVLLLLVLYGCTATEAKHSFLLYKGPKKTIPRMLECCRQFEADVVSKRSNKFLRTWKWLFGDPCIGGNYALLHVHHMHHMQQCSNIVLEVGEPYAAIWYLN